MSACRVGAAGRAAARRKPGNATGARRVRPSLSREKPRKATRRRGRLEPGGGRTRRPRAAPRGAGPRCAVPRRPRADAAAGPVARAGTSRTGKPSRAPARTPLTLFSARRVKLVAHAHRRERDRGDRPRPHPVFARAADDAVPARPSRPAPRDRRPARDEPGAGFASARCGPGEPARAPARGARGRGGRTRALRAAAAERRNGAERPVRGGRPGAGCARVNRAWRAATRARSRGTGCTGRAPRAAARRKARCRDRSPPSGPRAGRCPSCRRGRSRRAG